MTDNKRLEPEALREFLHCDPSTGSLFWRERDKRHFDNERLWKSFNTKWAGKRAFNNKLKTGYIIGSMFGVTYQSHRIIWAMSHGRWPIHEIDHINGNPSDNRLCNLREATRSQNNMNRRSYRGKSKFKGVHWNAREKRWVSQITKDGVVRYLGFYLSEDDAAQAYAKASNLYHGEFGRTF